MSIAEKLLEMQKTARGHGLRVTEFRLTRKQFEALKQEIEAGSLLVRYPNAKDAPSTTMFAGYPIRVYDDDDPRLSRY